MASHDFKRMNPGIQVKLLHPGVASPVNPRLVTDTSVVLVSMQSQMLALYGSNPNSAYALNSSGSLNLLISGTF